MSQQLRELLHRIERWPKPAQEKAIASLERIEDEMVATAELSAADRAALERSAGDVKQGRFATEGAVAGLFRRFWRA